jgi:CRISPR-associated protein Cas2
VRWVVCYDVADDGQRRRVFKTLRGYGDAIEESVFECELEERDVTELLERLERLMDPEEDRCHLFPICQDCNGKARVVGRGRRLVRKSHYIV